ARRAPSSWCRQHAPPRPGHSTPHRATGRPTCRRARGKGPRRRTTGRAGTLRQPQAVLCCSSYQQHDTGHRQRHPEAPRPALHPGRGLANPETVVPPPIFPMHRRTAPISVTAMVVSRAFANVLTDDPAATRDFYVSLLGLRVAFDSDWFVNLTANNPNTEGTVPTSELGIWRRDHELIPAEIRDLPTGTVSSFIVEDE